VTVNDLRGKVGGAVSIYEAIADTFWRLTGRLAPGKDSAAAAVCVDPAHNRAEWEAFLSLLGPSDKACIVAAYLYGAQP